jgi:dihydrofolate synthase / folylpolyglutamate synthase
VLGQDIPRSNRGYASVGDGVRAALSAAAAANAGAEAQWQGEGQGEVVLVCGTFFIMGEARQALGLHEPMDSKVIAEVAGAHFRASQEAFAALPKTP